MRSNETPPRLGLRKVVPAEGATDNTTVNIIAIHGLDTQSPRTWEFRLKEGKGAVNKKDGRKCVNWLEREDMLPAAAPEASIYTYDWNAKVFDNAPVQTLLDHADNLLGLLAAERGTSDRPIIFVASCFGGLILAEAICRAGQEGSQYRQILQSTIGIVFLATPFSGTDAADPASWLVLVKGIMGNDASDQLIKDLEKRNATVHERVQKFAEIANNNAIRLPIWCFFETKTTKIARRFLPKWIPDRFSHGSILVTRSSACLHGSHRRGLGKAHVMMNKFEGKDCPDFIQVKEAIKSILKEAPNTLKCREKDVKNTHFMVPFGRNANFVGRESILQQLLNRTSPSTNQDDCQRTAIEGLGGIGKTQIALEAAYRVRNKHPDCSVFWVPALNATSFENAYRDIGYRLQVKGIDNDKADIMALVKAALSDEGVGNWLLIIDNADDLNFPFADHLPFSRKGSILVTTRNHHVTVQLDISLENTVSIAEMNDAEAMDLLKSGLKETQMPDADSTARLLQFLAYLPLAIKQASAYMASNTNVTTSEYLSFCQSSHIDMIDLLGRNFEDRHRYKSIAREQNPITTTWLISFMHISKYDPQATAYLKSMCLLAEKDIPLSLLPEAGVSKKRVAEAISTLKAYAFITERKEPNSFDIHQLVRLAMRNWLEGKEEEWEEWTTKVFKRLSDEYAFPKHENREIWMRYLPHAQAVLQLRRSADEDTRLLNNVAGSYYSLGKYNEAEQIYRETLKLRKQVLGKERPETLRSMNNLANVLDTQGKYKEAEQMHQQVLELKRRILGKEHPDILASMNNLAIVLSNQGKYKEAEQILQQVLEVEGRALGKEHPDILQSMNNFAIVLSNQGKYKEAEQMHQQALEVEGRVLGEEHPDTLSSMNNLANVLAAQRKYKKAEQIHQQVLELREGVLGKEHPDTLRSMNSLANDLDSQGKYKEAEQMHQQALEVEGRVLGEEHPDTLSSMNNLANVLAAQRKYKEAEQIHQQALELKGRILGKEHPDTLSSMHNLAVVLTSQKKYKEAERIFRQVLQLRERVLGEKHPLTLDTKVNLDIFAYRPK